MSRRKILRNAIRLFAIVMAFIGAYHAAIYIQLHEFGIAFWFFLLVFLASIIEFIFSDILTEKIYPIRTQLVLDKLEKKLAIVEHQIRYNLQEAVEGLEGCDKTKINATIHRKINIFSSIDDERTEEALVQLMDYYGSSNRPPWRINSCYKGIIGRCLRTGKPEYVNFANEAEYKDRMVKEFGFTELDPKSPSKDARSYYAYPMILNNQLIGILFLYSTDLQVFPKSIDQRRIASISENIIKLLKTARIV